MKTLEEILSYTEQVGDCLEWTRCYNSDGYPRMAWNGSTNGKVHRIVYELSTGESPNGYVVRHRCDNPRCVNPSHLELGTALDNIKDREDRGRTHNQVKADEEHAIKSLSEAGFGWGEIANLLNVKYKRVEYVLYEKPKRKKQSH